LSEAAKGGFRFSVEDKGKSQRPFSRDRKKEAENSFYKDEGLQRDKIQANLKNPWNIHDA
jgi:hypothetical protein